ncbi:MAG: xanthine phosphoribosyltransferase [Negativicutes bacterium]|nr:xanthine phosphoribosyltransferase [Negativicutes bacterium]
MQELRERIIADGVIIGNDVLRVDSFLNHQIDPAFTMRMGQELARRFAGDGITKVLTVEASGIAVAMAVGLALSVPVVFAKKKQAVTQKGATYSAKIFSYTRRELTHITVTARYIGAEDTVLIIDDFLAHGEALRGLVSIVQQAGAKLAGAGIVIEKRFQRGGDALRAEGVRIESLAGIDSMEAGVIRFA